MRIPDRDLPPPEIGRDPLDKKMSRRQMKGLSKADWGGMESFTSVPQELELEGTHSGPIFSYLPSSSDPPSSFPPTPAPRQKSRALDARPPPRRETSGGGQQRGAPQPPPARTPAAPSHPPAKKGMTEHRREKRRENRRKKRQEAARLKAEAEDQAGGPNGTRHGREQRDTRSATARKEGGPATRTRSRSRIAEPRQRGPSSLVRIADVPVPPSDWTLVQSKRGKGKGQGKAQPNRKNCGTTYAEAATRPTPAQRRDVRGGAPPRPNNNNRGTPTRPQQQQPRLAAPKKAQPTPAPRKPPKTAAVQVTCPPGQYAETMRLARERVDIRGLGIPELRPRRARTGALLLEVPGADGGTKAGALAEKLRVALGDREGVTVSRPVKTAEMRVKDLEDSISAAEVAEALAAQGGCAIEDVRVGPIRPGTNRLGTAWVRCPLIAANRIYKRGRLTLGWTRVRVEPLPERATTCYKCLRAGHVRATCPNDEDRTDLCYRCGEAGHRASQCNREPKCPLCEGSGRPANHKAGSRACRAPKRAEKRPARREKEQRRGTDPPQTQPPPEPMETEPEQRQQQGPEPMDAETRSPSPHPPFQLDYPTSGEGWDERARPRPSQPEGLITGGGPGAAPLRTSRPQTRPVIREERVLDRRLVPIPVLAPDGQLTIGWRQEAGNEESMEEEAPPIADGGNLNAEGPVIPPDEEEAAAEQRPIGGGTLTATNGE